jgi:inositol 2-dehydrogenase
MDRLNIAVAGLGTMGQVHVASVARLPRAHLRAVASRREEVARAFAERYHADTFYTDYEQLFADPEVEAVVIASGILDHVEHIVQAARNGLHILTEKPIGFTLEAVDGALAAVDEAGVLFQVGFMRRFDPGYAAARKKIEEGAIGRPVLFKSTSRDPFWPEKQDGPGYNTTFLDLGVHDFDLARWLVGSEVSQVYATGGALVYPKLADFGDLDNAVVNLAFENGALGVVDLSRNARYGYDIRSEVLGDEGSLWIGELRQTPLLVLSRQGVTHDVFPWYADRFADAFEVELSAFVDAVLAGRAPEPRGIDGRRATEIGLAALESWRSAQPVKLPK